MRVRVGSRINNQQPKLNIVYHLMKVQTNVKRTNSQSDTEHTSRMVKVPDTQEILKVYFCVHTSTQQSLPPGVVQVHTMQLGLITRNEKYRLSTSWQLIVQYVSFFLALVRCIVRFNNGSLSFFLSCNIFNFTHSITDTLKT